MGTPELDAVGVSAMEIGTATIGCPKYIVEKPGMTTTASGEITASKHDITWIQD